MRIDHSKLIDDIISTSGNSAGIERALELPQGHLAKLKAKESIPKEDLVLLKLMFLYPRLIQAADNNFFQKEIEIRLLEPFILDYLSE